MAPKKAYFELLPQPDIKMAYTPIEDTANKYNIPMLISAITDPVSYGITAHDNKDSIKLNIGANIYIAKLACVGNIVSLANNFTPSAKGWSKPNTPTTFGPFLNCIDPNTFLSANVTYAIPINNGTMIAKTFRLVSMI